MPENLKRLAPVKNLFEFQRAYDNWRIKLGIDQETIKSLQGGLSRELIELRDAIRKGNNIDIAGEVADVFMFSMTALSTIGIRLDEVPIDQGKPIKTFSDLQQFAKKEALFNGYRVPKHNLDQILENIENLSTNKSLTREQVIEYSTNNILLSAMIMSQLNIPLADVLTAKQSRNLDKYNPEQVNLIKQLNWISSQKAMAEMRREWNPNNDRKYMLRQLGLFTYARLSLSEPISKIKQSAIGMKSRQFN